jgi:Flp pilus assembly protein TadD
VNLKHGTLFTGNKKPRWSKVSRRFCFCALMVMSGVFMAGADAGAPVTAEDYYKSGKAKYKNENYTGAIEDYNKAAELAPDVAKIYGSRGAARRKIGDREGAIADAQKAARLGDKDARRILRMLDLGW